MINIEEIIEKVKYILLPPAFMCTGYIRGKGAPSCNYEEYLTELLNESTYFRKRTDGRKIKLIEQQDYGQPDICENGFSLDFKLIGGESAITAQKLTSKSIRHLFNGGVGYGLAAGREKGYEAVRIHLAVRNYTCDELIELNRNYRKDNIIQHDVVHLLKNLSVDKNLLLYLPYAIVMDKANEREAEEIIAILLEDCLGSSLEYRKKMVSNKETFLCCIHNQKMLFYTYGNNKLSFIDAVYTYSSETFLKLARYYDLEGTIIDAIIGRDRLWKKEN